MALHQSVQPKWVLVDGALWDVSTFAALKPGNRPIAICPVCAEQVILKLGRQRAHHYAHQAASTCPANAPETALHLNTKFYIAEQLRSAQRLTIEQLCSAVCKSTRILTWAEDWTDIKVEYTLAPYRPDIAILRGDQVIAVVEVLVSHAVDDLKANYLNEQGLPWLELQAREDIYQDAQPWTANTPLPFRRLHPQLEAWMCEECSEKAEVRRRVEEYNRKNYHDISSGKIIDYYFPSGKKLRMAYYTNRRYRDGELDEIWISDEKDNTIAREFAPITDVSYRRLNQSFRRHVAGFVERGAFVDEFMGWQPWVKGQKVFPKDTKRFRFRYAWDPQRRQWVYDSPPSL